jgi:hypothetical protein
MPHLIASAALLAGSVITEGVIPEVSTKSSGAQGAKDFYPRANQESD